MYEHRYKHGKQKEVMPNAVFEAAIKDAVNRGESREHIAYVVFVHYFGVRKSEAYERPVNDVTVTKDFVIVDFHTRKKHGLEVSPNEVPREWFGVNEYLVPYIKQRVNSKPPHRKSWKTIFRQVETGKYRRTEPTPRHPKGVKVSVKKRVGEKRRDLWLFPHVSSTQAWMLYKQIYGDKYYPHYDRLWRLSMAAKTADNMGDMISAVRRVSGLKTLDAMQAYFGDSKKVGDKAMHTLPDSEE
jgi:hypothetical protein